MTCFIRPRGPHSRQLFQYPTEYSGVQSSSFTTRRRVRKGQTGTSAESDRTFSCIGDRPATGYPSLRFSCPSRTCTSSAVCTVIAASSGVTSKLTVGLPYTPGSELKPVYTSPLDGGAVCSRPRPGRCTHGNSTGTHCYTRLERAPVWFGVERRKSFPLLGFEPRTF